MFTFMRIFMLAISDLVAYCSGGKISLGAPSMTATFFIALIASTVAIGLLLRKMGDHWWKCLIPVYNFYRLCKDITIGNDCLGIISSCVIMLLIGVGTGGSVNTGYFLLDVIIVIFTIALVINFVRFEWRFCKGLAYSFGYERGCAFGLFFLFPLFLLIIVFGKAKYVHKPVIAPKRRWEDVPIEERVLYGAPYGPPPKNFK